MAVFPTGDMGTIKEGELVKAGSFYVENNKLMYELEDGTKGEYRHLEELSKKYLQEEEITEMLI